MTWTKLDDGLHSHPKIRKAWREPRAVGLHLLAINYATCHELDGKISPEFVEDYLPDAGERERVVAQLEACGLWDRNGVGWEIHDFLQYQPSKQSLREKREADAKRKREERKR